MNFGKKTINPLKLFAWVPDFVASELERFHGSPISAGQALQVRPYVISIKEGPWLFNHVSKVWQLLVRQNKTENIGFNLGIFVCLFQSHKESPCLLIHDLKTLDYPLFESHRRWPAAIGNPNHWISLWE